VKGHPGIETNEFVVRSQLTNAVAVATTPLQADISAVSNLAISAVTSVGAASPLSSSGGTTPTISLSGQIADGNIADTLTIGAAGSVNGAAITDGSITSNKLHATVDARYVNAAGDTMDDSLAVIGNISATGTISASMIAASSAAFNSLASSLTVNGALTVTGSIAALGAITAPSLTITGTTNWYVGNNSYPSVPVHLVMVSDGGELQSLYDLRLRAANGEIQFKSPVKFDAGINEAGRAGRTNNATTSGSGCTITVPSCTPNSVVLITPTTNTAPANFWVEAVSNSFTVKSTDTNIWSFNYLVR
jgi:hypothetical protein